MIVAPFSSRKRKERESQLASSEVISTTKPLAPAVPAQPGARQAIDNSLLAGYMAYEFLKRGTLLGQRLDPGRAYAAPVGSSGSGSAAEPSGSKDQEMYAEVASILKMEGAHIPGIVNPTQLTRWIKM